jgi:hypothetical protein
MANKRPRKFYPSGADIVSLPQWVRFVTVGDKVQRGKMLLFDDLVGTRQERWRDIDAKRPCGSQVDYEFEFGRLQNW